MINLIGLRYKKMIFSRILIFLFTVFSFSQDLKHTSPFWENVQFGGGLGLNIGNDFFSGAVAPNALYRFNPYVAAGVGLNFQYSSQRDIFKSTVLGASALGLFNPYREIQLSAEFEQLHVNRKFESQFESQFLPENNSRAEERYWYPALFMGIGYTNGNVTTGIRYDILYNEDKSIQPEAWMPFVRFWF